MAGGVRWGVEGEGRVVTLPIGERQEGVRKSSFAGHLGGSVG